MPITEDHEGAEGTHAMDRLNNTGVHDLPEWELPEESPHLRAQAGTFGGNAKLSGGFEHVDYPRIPSNGFIVAPEVVGAYRLWPRLNPIADVAFEGIVVEEGVVYINEEYQVRACGVHSSNLHVAGGSYRAPRSSR